MIRHRALLHLWGLRAPSVAGLARRRARPRVDAQFRRARAVSRRGRARSRDARVARTRARRSRRSKWRFEARAERRRDLRVLTGSAGPPNDGAGEYARGASPVARPPASRQWGRSTAAWARRSSARRFSERCRARAIARAHDAIAGAPMGAPARSHVPSADPPRRSGGRGRSVRVRSPPQKFASCVNTTSHPLMGRRACLIPREERLRARSRGSITEFWVFARSAWERGSW